MQYSFRTIDYQRMPGIMPALKTHHGFGRIAEQVNNLALALVTPLSTDNYN